MRSTCWCTVALLALALAPPVFAQRTIETHPISDPEGSLMGYYSALMIFAPDGAPQPASPWTVDLTANLGYVPPLSYDQRTAGRDKPESTNLTSVFGYPKVTLWLPYHIGVEAAYTLPFTVNGATPAIYSFAAEVLAATDKGWQLVPRVTYTGGYVEGPITCNKSLSTSGNPDWVFYWNTVCNAQESADRFEPNQWTLELNASGSSANGKLLPFLNIGVVKYQSTFDIRVQNGTGIDTDHPILKMNATKGYGTAGATWILSPLFRLGGALFWAPGSVFTGRLSATLRLNAK
jgi:hypothetical protein